MKKILPVLFTLVIIGCFVVFAGCGEGEGGGNGPLKGKDIVGEWKVCGAEYIGIEMDLEDLEWTRIPMLP